MRIVHNAVDLQVFAPDGPVEALDRLAGLAPAAAGVVRVGLVATFARWKGHEVFLRALAAVPSTALTRGFQDLSREWLTLTQAHLERNIDAINAIRASCRSLSELFKVQSELVRNNLQHTLEDTQRMVSFAHGSPTRPVRRSPSRHQSKTSVSRPELSILG